MPSRWIPKVHRGRLDNQGRKIGCPAWPSSGEGIKGASREWCLGSRGQMKACLTCDWREEKDGD
jgi:hypothetical protein